MNVSTLSPIFNSLRMVLNLVVVSLIGFIVVREAMEGDSQGVVAIVLAAGFLATYAGGAVWLRREASTSQPLVLVWLGLLTAEALALVWISPNAAYLVFPLFFLYLHLMPKWWGVVAVALCTMLTIGIFAIEDRISAAGVIGPVIAAIVAVTIGLGYRALYWENQERMRLIEELLATREELIEKEREAGVLSERARLAREIHDTVAQGLSSIQLLLHAAERADGERPGIEHIRLARQTAAVDLEETRRFIRELTPQALDNQTLAAALDRLAQSTQSTNAQIGNGRGDAGNGPEVAFRTSGDPVALPMHLETALLRLAQGALANAVKHARATRVTMTLTYMEQSVSLDIVDNGIGFDPGMVSRTGTEGSRQSFGLVAMRERVDQLGGTLSIESTPQSGTAMAITFGLDK